MTLLEVLDVPDVPVTKGNGGTLISVKEANARGPQPGEAAPRLRRSGPQHMIQVEAGAGRNGSGGPPTFNTSAR